MATTLRTILFILLFAFITQIQFNLDADKTATRQMKNALEIAVHDAALATSPSDMANGRIVFDQTLATNNLKASLQDNLEATSDAGFVYTPNNDSLYKNELYLVHLEFIDDNVTTTYPYVYTNPYYEIIERVDGPSVIAVISTESPRWFNGNKTYIRQAAVYEYKK
ncbi:peptidase M23 [Fictibacillus phosphorivorans]|uniref:Peptidase M23 n=1 Tax=Fictibacillus phosphorivorans TaxID=1221500 RepID=A0A163S391_9BACL|nr:peptidase M23 [Fictibacillus phosphorivorans]KZE68044.1 peptidase M23 [Fictibacillus phosphorivorans]